MHSRTFKDSGEIVLSNTTTISACCIFVFDVDERFKPYNQVSIINNSDSDITLSSNYGNSYDFLIPKGNQRILDIITEDIRIKNEEATLINIGEIKLNIRNDGTREKEKIKSKLNILADISMVWKLFT